MSIKNLSLPFDEHLSLVENLYWRWENGDGVIINDTNTDPIHLSPQHDSIFSKSQHILLMDGHKTHTSIDHNTDFMINQVNARQLQKKITHCAGYLRAWGLEQGDVMALQAPKSIEWMVVFLAALSQGIIVLLLNPKYAGDEVIYYLKQSKAKRAILIEDVQVFVMQNHSELYTDISDIQPAHHISTMLQYTMTQASNPTVCATDVAVLAYTSGTTGHPKGAKIRHGDIMATLHNLHQAWQWSSQDCLVHTLPIFHIHGLFVAALGSLWAAARCVFLYDFDAYRTLEAIESHQASILMGVPTHHHRYLQLTQSPLPNLSSLRLVTSGSAPLLASQHQAFKEKFNIEITERYGMTEIGIVISNPIQGIKKAGSIGQALGQVQVQIIKEDGCLAQVGEVGELYIHAPSLFAGYLDLPDATQQALHWQDDMYWMRTGDLGYKDQDHYYFLVGRRSDLLITGGLNVYPIEIENAIWSCIENQACEWIEDGIDLKDELWIKQLAIIGVDSVEWGDQVVAAIIVHPRIDLHHTAKYLTTLTQSIRQKVATYKCPKEWRLFVDFPRNAMGKLQKKRLREVWNQGQKVAVKKQE